MKKQVLALALFCCCLIGFAKDKRPINYRFHKNDTINFLSTTERDGSTSSSKYQVVVLESKGKKALLKFNVLSFGDEIEEDSTPTDSAINFIQNKEAFLEMFKSKMVSPIIQFEKGEAKKIVNFEEQKASMKELMNVILNEYSKNPKMNQDKPMNDSILVFIKNFMMPMVDEFLTEEMFLKDYSSIVLNDIPQKLGEFNKNDGKTILQSSLTATQIAGEYAFRQICKMELSKEDLKNSERKDNPVVNMISNMGLGGKLMLAFVDSMQFETTKSGVVYSNGLPKHFVEETRVSFSAMGKKKEMRTKQTVSIIENEEDYDYAKELIIKADSVVSAGETYHFYYSYNAKDSTEKIVSSSWNAQNNRDYIINSGPTQSTINHHSYKDGKISKIIEKVFSFNLTFNKEGVYTLPPILVKTTSGKKIKSKPFTVRVTKNEELLIGQIVVNVDSIIKVGNKIFVEYTYFTDNSDDKIVSHTWNWDKSGDDYTVLFGPSGSFSSRGSSSVNGPLKTINRYSFTFMLIFNKEGVFTLPPMIAKTTSGKELQSQSFNIKAIKGDTNTFNENKKYRGIFSPKDEFLVAEAVLDKDHIELGDSVECEIRLFTNKYIDVTPSYFYNIKPVPISQAYWKSKSFPQRKSFETVEYKGDSVYSVLLKKISITPIQSGKITIDPMDFRVIRKITNPGIDSFHYLLYGLSQLADTVKTNSLTIEVAEKQLPAKDIRFDIATPKHNTGIVIDRSSSLNSKPDSVSSSFSQIQNLFLEHFLDESLKSNYSITYFAEKPHYPTTSELSNVLGVIASKENDGSAIYDALLASALREGALTTERAPYSILLLTDGNDKASRLSEKTLTNLLLKHKIRVDVIAFASTKDSIYHEYEINDAIKGFFNKNFQDYSDVERIAKATNGQFILVENESQIPEAIRTIREKIEKAEAPKQKPEKQFKPEKSLLYGLYKEIMSDAKTDF